MHASLTLTVLAVMCLHGCAGTRPAFSARDALDPLDLPEPLAHTTKPAPPTPLHVEVWTTVHGSARGPLFSEMQLNSGDQIGLQVRTSSAADVYLIHCDGHQTLSVFPASGPVRFPRDRRVQLPAVGKRLRLARSTGSESIYILATKHPLAETDPELHALLANAQNDGGSEACGDELEALLAGESQPSAGRPGRSALRGVESTRTPAAVAHAFAVDGVVVLGFRYQHVR